EYVVNQVSNGIDFGCMGESPVEQEPLSSLQRSDLPFGFVHRRDHVDGRIGVQALDRPLFLRSRHDDLVAASHQRPLGRTQPASPPKETPTPGLFAPTTERNWVQGD